MSDRFAPVLPFGVRGTNISWVFRDVAGARKTLTIGAQFDKQAGLATPEGLEGNSKSTPK